MYLRKITRKKDGKIHAYWALVESRRTPQGPRQQIVAYLGEMDVVGRLGLQQAAEMTSDQQTHLFETVNPEWVEIDLQGVRTEHVRDFGDVWLALELLKRLELWRLFHELVPRQREKIPWAILACVLVIARLCEPNSELYLAEHYFERTALSDLLGIPSEPMYANRLYRALDHLLPHKETLEKHLKERFGQLFGIQYDLILYDVTSTYFEGQARKNLMAKRGYSRDKRPDCKQICIALIVTREGIPLGYEIFEGNRKDTTTVTEIVQAMEKRYGAANRVWVMDRGMVSQSNIEFLKAGNRRYIIGTPKSALKTFENELLSENWQVLREELEVKYCPAPDNKTEVYILCRSTSRKQKEQAILERSVENIQSGLDKIHQAAEKGRMKSLSVAERRIGRLLQSNHRAARLFDIQVIQTDSGKLGVQWSRQSKKYDWKSLSTGCYLLRSNITDWSAEELWTAYIHLTDAEAAFRIHKSDLHLRPIWHQKTSRVQAHIFVCFLSFVLWKCLAQLCKQKGLGDEPRKIIDELKQIKLTDVILPTKKGVEITLHCVTKPTAHQQILLQHLKLNIPSRLTKMKKM